MSRKHWLLLAGLLTLVVGCGRPPVDQADLQPATITRGEPRATRPASTPPFQGSAGTGPVQVYFSEVWQSVAANKANPRSIAEECVRFIESAQSTLDVCCFEIDNRPIIDAVVRAERRGVRVRVVTEQDYLEEAGPQTFKRFGIPVISDNRSDLMHNKFIVADGNRVWTGSFNFTDNCAYKNNNNGVTIEDRMLAENYTEKFRWFWEYRKFGGAPSKTARIPHPVVKLVDGTVVENYFSTHDRADRPLIAAILKARQSIRFMAFSFTHEGIAQAMLDRAADGVQVVGVVESRQNSKYSEVDRLNRGRNVQVLLDGNSFNMHHKVIIIDDQVVVTGSFNFSASATSGNDENLVIIHSRAVAERFNEEFRRVYRAADNALAETRGKALPR